ncbi:hypothetical protein GCK72_011648 [Caenorhabditis remanei]|uniref:SCP domain-containing protein n=1 Tax=Caenorhabditis remanei TaxID=31234 RepID=A0A6A5HAH9_CAERE|nr:hypothetical protein GCK72_011648 [Caenorhabditis remanei]KAF1763382.1 hypothetical protein GCK72_011648 [Caenorhabditis remanei]
MKTSLLFGFILVYAFSVTVEATKGGLSKDEQKKLLDALNKDRVRAQTASSGIVFQHLTYDLELEKKAAAYDCKPGGSSSSGVALSALQWNSVGDEIYEEVYKGTKEPSLGLFDWRQTKIGCSKEVTCRIKIKEGDGLPAKFVGKEIVIVGGCILGPLTTDVSEEDKRVASELGLPKASKYGDLLGIKMSSSGRVFNLIVFLALSVFYF